MTIRLWPCLLLILLLHFPAQGQDVGRTSADTPSTAFSKSGSYPTGAENVDLDLPMDGTTDAPAREGLNAADLASRVIDLLAAQNAIELFRQSEDGLDAYLRPPTDSDEENVFHVARAAIHDATTIESDVYQISVDPLKMRCVVRINLNRRFGR